MKEGKPTPQELGSQGLKQVKEKYDKKGAPQTERDAQIEFLWGEQTDGNFANVFMDAHRQFVDKREFTHISGGEMGRSNHELERPESLEKTIEMLKKLIEASEKQLEVLRRFKATLGQ